ncbi:hypothetical protein A0O34_16590 [Chryseobacterium glaciei]|uniref:Uncharacterized protein n=1 Tax=Chryseobacterium glaciei TaxID=1685010 RepID=A0A172XYU6_9FLAO|nr:hypothetical protein [Chryseobacterium glaciei]ANF52032.1 hypothetical protein A0O34_16590 [Chryseobacterium glaciei]
MEAAKCNVLLKLEYDYTPSVPITSSTAVYKYRIKNSMSPYTELAKNPAPMSEEEVSLPDIQSAGEYELKVELAVNGATDEETFFFQVDKCDVSFCKDPSIEKVYLGVNDQIIMDYTVDETDLNAVEYQIATDSQFHNIIHFRVLLKSDYKPTEYIEMNDGTIINETKLFIRARKHCSPSGVSVWSNVVEFTSGKWGNLPVLYPFDFAYCVSGKFEGKDPRDIGEGSICQSSNNPFARKVYLTTPVPEIGSFIYNRYVTPARPAVKGDLLDFDGVNSGFNEYGLRWIRFEKDGINPTVIYDVEPTTGEIVNISLRYNCNF